VVKNSTSSLTAELDKTNQKLTLSLLTTTLIEEQEKTEFSIIYEFDILKNQKIKFRQVRVAG
jgi:hypothetical protein